MALEEEVMKKKAIAILFLLAVMFCAFAEEKTLNVNLSIVPIFEVKWTGTQLTEDNAKTTSLDSLSAPDPIVLNSDNNYTSKSTIYASWRTNYAQPLKIEISSSQLSNQDVEVELPVKFSTGEADATNKTDFSSDSSATYKKDALNAPVDGSYLRYDSIPVTGITVSEDALKTITVPAGSKLGTAVEFTGTMKITVTVG